MTVSNQTPYVEYTANGSTTNFSLTFDCDNADNLIVKVNDVEAIGTWTLQGSTVVFITAPIANSIVSIERDTPLERTSNYQTYDDSFSPKPVNKDFDSIWWKLQELYYKLINKVSIKRKINTVGGLTGGGDLSSDLNISIENQNIEPKTYGSSIKIPVITVNEKGIITGISVADFAGGGGSTIQVGFEDILNLPTTILGYGITDALNKNSNLGDLQDKAAARTNLDVYSKTAVDNATAQATETALGTAKIATTAQAQALTNDTTFLTPLKSVSAIRAALNAGGNTPIYACRAWVNFNAIPLTGTYAQSGTTVTVTMTAHGMKVGAMFYATVTSGTGVTGSYTVATVIDANTFTYVAGTSLTTSGNITRSIHVRSSGNVSSVVYLAVGEYVVYFTTAMPDADYAPIIAPPVTDGSVAYGLVASNGSTVQAANSIRFVTTNSTGSSATNFGRITLAIYR
ncbi:hypothetical protein P255_00989 [Acinetobacter brisouii CIP 110357]|uniref:Uncharacterized protein n=1 Tax=Acinetobacter brisouii CIP 110357 TaxID=1341683 RepID=V2VVX5_9GAMM|nr:hypothetical protein [Acinetobacter brisouii]ENV48110.1 hypothetical protein F954_01177 [Acinetobacter brisouii ANC 4119]ESK51894.1 hypothetical protein P255_00989 [Acinetobacter brisouii CIP 110357]